MNLGTVADLHYPTRVIFGSGALDQIGELARGWSQRALVVTDPGMRATGLVDRVCGLLATAGVETVVYDGVAPNPSVDQVEAGLDAGADYYLAKASFHDDALLDVVVALIGGGRA